MTRIRIYPYKQGSRSAAVLAEALGGRVLKLEGSRFRPRPDDLIINWGASQTPNYLPVVPLNPGTTTGIASNKLNAFRVLQECGVRIPEFWTNCDEIPDEAFERHPVVCRTVLNGHSGRGIFLAATREELVEAPLYVKYIPKQDEYRVHVVNGAVIAVQRKARRVDVDNPDWRIRNHANGFNFVRDGVVAPADVIVQGIGAVASLGLDFGAVDVVYNARQQQAYVLEINTAPGLEGQTITDYATAFSNLINR